MTEMSWRVPSSVLESLARAPSDRPIAVLLRHSVRDELPPDDVGYALPITDTGRRLSVELGRHLRGRLRTLHTSPLARCVQTAEALAEGAQTAVTVIPNQLLGDPGAFVLDGQRAWTNWEQLGHEGVVQRMVSESDALPGMARPDEAARFLVQSMFAAVAGHPGVHIFVTHDTLVMTTVSRLLGKALGPSESPSYLEGGFFWTTDDGCHTLYRGHEALHAGPLCDFSKSDVIEFARREIASTVGLDSGARLVLAGDAFMSLLTGRPPRILELWAPSERDRALIIDALHTRGAFAVEKETCTNVFEKAGQRIEVQKTSETETLSQRLARFDIGLAAVGVEHRPDDTWSAFVHPIALDSVRSREVRLLKPLERCQNSLVTLKRMHRYAIDLNYSMPSALELDPAR